jgi:hypothetical protein
MSLKYQRDNWRFRYQALGMENVKRDKGKSGYQGIGMGNIAETSRKVDIQKWEWEITGR